MDAPTQCAVRDLLDFVREHSYTFTSHSKPRILEKVVVSVETQTEVQFSPSVETQKDATLTTLNFERLHQSRCHTPLDNSQEITESSNDIVAQHDKTLRKRAKWAHRLDFREAWYRDESLDSQSHTQFLLKDWVRRHRKRITSEQGTMALARLYYRTRVVSRCLEAWESYLTME